MSDAIVEISVDSQPFDLAINEASQNLIRLGYFFHPEYGDDALHNARLIGAYHVRKGWGDSEQMLGWRCSLHFADDYFIRRYETRREWGQMKLDEPRQITVPIDGQAALAAAVDHFNKAIGEFGKALADSFAPILECFSPTPDFEQILIAVERINLRRNLERAFIPSTAACWLARRWPVWALPAVAWMRLRNRWETLTHDN